MNKPNIIKILLISLLFLILASCSTVSKNNESVKSVMDEVITRLYQTNSEQELVELDYSKAMSLFSEKDWQVLAARHWMFDANVPVVVSVMRSIKQEIVPFWLIKNGFVKTTMTIRNENTTYEVWQKPFNAGRVGLGINGLENYSLHYFVSVAPQNKNDKLQLTNFFPENQYVGILDNGAFTYHDWDELVLTDVPDELKGQKLLTTVRGRGTESHLVGAFRKTNYPSSAKPDQVILTWSSDPSTGIDIQWRTDTTVSSGKIKLREKGISDIHEIEAEKLLIEDRMVFNDRFNHHFTARIRNLKPATSYEYLIGSQTKWTNNQSFATSSNSDSFSFLWFGDTHYSSKFGEILKVAWENHYDAAFYSIVGDLVSEGLHRNQWDELLKYTENISGQIPLMAVPGNHDNRAGLGAYLYRRLFSYPENGPAGVPSEQTYSFNYKNALFLMIDATSPFEAQTQWIENQLSTSKAKWKIAMFHFPPYNCNEPYPAIQKLWVPLFDKYHVDLVFGGHVHYYMRSNPLKAGKLVNSFKDGTVYIISIGIPSHQSEMSEEPYAAVRFGEGQFYQYLKIEGKKCMYRAYDSENKLVDTLTIKK